MFKRVEKSLKRKQREDELGLDGEMVQILGLNDTDSNESGSDDNSNDDSSEGDLPEDKDDEDVELEEVDEESDPDTRKCEQEEGERALITVSEALNDPVFIISLDPDIKECIVCPGKLLKGAIMIGKHKSSNACTLSLPSNSYAQPTRLSPNQAHERRFKQFQRLAASATLNTKAQELVMEVTGERPQTSTTSSTSKRAEKKRIAQEKRKIKREKLKTRQRNKKEALANNVVIESKKESKRSGKGVGGEQEEKEIAEGKKQGEAVERSKKVDTSASTSAPTGSSTELVDVIKVKRHRNKSVAEPPKKKRKASSSTVPTIKFNSNVTMPSFTDKSAKLKPTTSPTKPKSKPKPMSEPDDSPAVIQRLQLQVKDIIKSASSFAKAARARALNDDSDSNEKVPSIKKRKLKAQKP